jgi:hypothetical protein
MELDPVSEKLFSSYLEIRKMDKVQKRSDPVTEDVGKSSGNTQRINQYPLK